MVFFELLLLFSPISFAQTNPRSALNDEPIHGFGLVDAFPGVEFTQPVVIAGSPASPNSLFVAERGGVVYALTNLSHPKKTVFLDLSVNTVAYDGIEPGLLGMAFHPQFASNGYVFVYRTVIVTEGASPGYYNRLSRFRVDPHTPFFAQASTEEVVLQQRDNAFHIHNAGDIHFGPDGYLYVALGEAAPPPEDFRLTRQPIDKNFFGVILRIDVDQRPGNLKPNPHPGISDLYLVPRDNPFVNATEYQGVPLDAGKVRTEIFALGFRNPWRFCFDPTSGEIFCGDVGEQAQEEVNLVRPGANYGWPYQEALHFTQHYAARPSGYSSEPPLWNYAHESTLYGGQAIVGGRVYVGNELPGLRRAYVFGDNVRGHIWALLRDEIHGTNEVRWLTGEPGLSTFGIDPRDKEILVASLITGRLRKLVFRDPAQSSFPRLLSQTGLFSDTKNLLPAPDAIPYEVNVPFWSDFAEKRRWVILPQDSFVRFNASNHWSFPTGTIWIKHFDLDLTRNDPTTRRRLSTRLLVKTESSAYGVAYKWNSAGTDAELLDSAGGSETIWIKDERGVRRPQVWNFPSRLECRLCHSPQAGYALAFNTEQLNCPDLQTGENQIGAFARKGILTEFSASPASLPALASATNRNFSTEYRVRSFMQANCAQCHRPDNPIIARWDARFHTPMHEKSLAPLVTPNAPDSSMLYTRLAIPDFLRMPPISSSELNVEALQLMRDWVEGIPAPPWQDSDVGTPVAKGNGLVNSGTIEVAGYAGSNGAEAGHYLFRSGAGSVQVVARLSDRKLSDPSSQAGIRLVALNGVPRAYLAGVTSDSLISRTDSRTLLRQTNGIASGPIWLRVTSEMGWVNFFQKMGSEWERVEAVRFPVDLEINAGLSVMSANTHDEQFARFEDVSILSGRLLLIEGKTNQTGQANARIECRIDGHNYAVEKVEFAANGRVLGESRTAPYLLDWRTNAPGTYRLTARIVTQDGLSLSTSAVTVQVNPHESQGWLYAQDATTQGGWKERFGSLGYFTPEFFSWPVSARLSISNVAVRTLDRPVDSPSLLTLPDSTIRSLSYWSGKEVVFSVEFLDRILHRISLYFADPGGIFGDQRLTVRDKYSKEPLFEGSITNYADGLYLSLLVKGSVEFAITGDLEAGLMGVFLDESPFPAPILRLPIIPKEVMGSSFLSIAPAYESGAVLEGLEILLDGSVFQKVSGQPSQVVLSNLIPGDHLITLRATDVHEQITETTNIPLRVLLPPAAAKFLGTDDQIQGDWKNSYGKQGYLIVQGGTNLPAHLKISPTNHSVYEAFASSNDRSALALPNGSGRIFSCWTASFQFDIDVALNDGMAKQVSLYVSDGPDSFREQMVRVIDPATGYVLSEQILRNFEAGRYYKWSVQGAVRFEISARSGSVLINGVFLDGIESSLVSVSVLGPESGVSIPVPSRLTAQLLASGPIESVQRTELYLDNRLLVEYPGHRERVDLPRVVEGNHWLSAAVADANGTRVWSSPVLLIGQVPIASAEFQKEDSSTAGTWKGSYGTDGFVIAGDSTNLPPLASVIVEPNQLWYWEGETGKSALLRRSEGRIAAGWFTPNGGDTSLKLNLLFPDGEPRRVALYFLDYESNDRSLRINIHDSQTGTLLDSRPIAEFEMGKYLVWKVRGSVTIQVNSVYGAPILSGVFIDPGLTYEDWLSYEFATSSELSTAPSADPDGDGIQNLLEFLTMSNPLRRNALWNLRYEPETGDGVFEIALGRNRAGILPVIEVTGDLKKWHPAEAFQVTSSVRLNITQTISQYRILPGLQRPLFFRLGAVETQ